MSDTSREPANAPYPGDKGTRLLIVLPTWIGDAVMATPALHRLRAALPGYFIGGLSRPGPHTLLERQGPPVPGSEDPLLDELHIDRRAGIMGPKKAAAKLRARRYDHALLLSNSFSAALAVRMAGVPERTGYDRDGRGFLLTHRLTAPKRPDGKWALIPAVRYYHDAADALLAAFDHDPKRYPHGPMKLPLGAEERNAADEVLANAGLESDDPFAILNPGGNNPAKRWPPDRFAALAKHLRTKHGLRCVVSGSPGESDLCAQIEDLSDGSAVSLPRLGLSIPALKSLAQRARLMITNDTGPRHIAAAFATPLVSLFGPTDHRWTTIPTHDGAPEIILVADPTLPESESSNDHPERCAVDRITLERVTDAADRILSGAQTESIVA